MDRGLLSQHVTLLRVVLPYVKSGGLFDRRRRVSAGNRGGRAVLDPGRDGHTYGHTG